MTKTIFAASVAALALLTAPAYAERLTANGGGHLSGSASSFAGTAGASFGNGKSSSEAGQFAGSMTTLKGGLTEGRDGLTITGTTETFVQGFDKSSSSGLAASGAIRGGAAWGDVNYWGGAFGEW